MKQLDGKVAVVTGAGSGIGRATAIELAKEGCHLAISDINIKELESTRQTIENMGTLVHVKVLDVADKKAFHDYASEVAEKFGKVNIVINNAGVALGATIENTSYEDFEWLMNINFWGMVYGTKAFLPYLKQTGKGHICNISSVLGFMTIPKTGAYNTSKFAIRGFNETLQAELEIENCGVSLSSIHPGGIKTNIARDSRVDELTFNNKSADKDQRHQWFNKIAHTSPESAAKMIIKGIKKDQMRVLIGIDAHIIYWATRLTPILFHRLIIKLIKIRIKRREKNKTESV